MKPTSKPSKAQRQGGSAKEVKKGSRAPDAPVVANSVRQWARQSVKKTPVDTAEGGSGQP